MIYENDQAKSQDKKKWYLKINLIIGTLNIKQCSKVNGETVEH